MKEQLAILGGTPVRKKPFPPYNSIGKEEYNAAAKVINSGVLSQFLGCWTDDFFGGPNIKKFESKWASTISANIGIAL